MAKRRNQVGQLVVTWNLLSLTLADVLARCLVSLGRHLAPWILGWEMGLLVPPRRVGIQHFGWNSH